MPSRNPRRRGRPISDHAAFRRMAGDLRRRIVAGEWKSGGILPSLRKLAKEYRVSVDVAREAMLVLRREERVGITPRRRLAIRSHRTPVPDMAPDRAVLAIVTAPLDKALASGDVRDVLAGILAGAGMLRVPITLVHTYYFRDALPSECLERPWRGILLYGALRQELLRSYERLPLPVVLVDQPCGSARLHTVCLDNMNAAREATERLLALGHRQIAFLRRISTTRAGVDLDSMERQSGFLEAHRLAGLPRPRNRIFSCLSHDSPHSAVFRAAAGPDAPFTALLCADAGLAAKAREVALAHGKRVPEDVSIACFQRRSGRLSFSGPCADFFSLGQGAVQLLDRPPSPPCTQLVPAVWEDAGSVARVKNPSPHPAPVLMRDP